MHPTGGLLEATETSPLLGKVATNSSVCCTPSDIPNGSIEDGTVAGTGTIADEEAGASSVDNPLLEGMPDVAAQLKWLLPAVGIGVSLCTLTQVRGLQYIWRLM